MLHIIQNDSEVPPGNITEILESMGILFFVHHPYLGDPLPATEHISALIVMGGAMGANDDDRHPFLYDLRHFIKEVVADGIPYLGICLGGQLLAAACGGRVASNRWDELGTLEVEQTEAGRDDRLFDGIKTLFTTFQWHHDSFDLPAGAVLLASSAACPHQAFRIGSCAWGLQFHPEVSEEIIRNWCAWDPATTLRTKEIVSAWQAQKDGYCEVSRRMVKNFVTSNGISL